MKKTARKLMTRQTVGPLLVLLGLFAFQAVQLDSDPSQLFEGYQFNDEGYWNHSARCKVLFGTFLPDDFNQDMIASPLFTLIQWGVFSIAGVSLFSARLLPMMSLWLTLLMVYYLVRRNSSSALALLAVLMLGLLHEMLMYTKWSTPIITQACFLTAIALFWELGKRGSRWWMAACGASLAAAVFTTLLALHCLPGILLFLALALWVRREVDVRRIVVFLGVALALGVAVGVFYYLPHLDQVRLFMRTVGSANLANDPSSGRTNAIQSLQALPFLEIFCSPGVAPLTMLASLWLVDLLVRIAREGLATVVTRMHSVELYCTCWILGALPSIIATPTIGSRRFVIFLAPLVVTTTFFLGRVWKATPSDATTTASHGRCRGRWPLVGWCLVAAVWCECVWKGDAILHARWLTQAGLNVSPWITATACMLVVGLAGVYFLLRKRNACIAILLGCFVVVNLGLTALWYGFATYTIRDTSRRLRDDLAAKEYFLGYYVWELAFENACLPLYPPWGKRMRMNEWFIEESKRVSFLINDDGKGDLAVHLSAERLSAIGQIRLFPLLFGDDEYHYKATLYRVKPLVNSPNESNAAPKARHPIERAGT
jgi:4-amino-4-deoxy-L-arabinose transferase-like glycosyltransferase